MTCILTPAQVNQAFLTGAPLMAGSILNLSLQAPSFYSDLYTTQAWPEGQGTMMEQLIFRGSLPTVEEGFKEWRALENNTGCDPCEGPDCSYNWTTLGGHGFQRKVTNLMDRDFKSPAYCVKQIQTTFQFENVFEQIVQNLYNQIRFQKEINIGQNFLTGIAKKLMVDSAGIKANYANPYAYAPKGTTVLSMLTIGILEHIYEVLRTMPDAVPYDVVDGQPIFALSGSPQLLSRLYKDDPQLRQDARFSSAASDLLNKYNFQTTIRGMFFQVPWLWPRRFRWTGTGWNRVLPFVNGVPAESGSYTQVNPQYIDPTYATHEELLIHGKNPFTVWYQPTVETLGEGTTFGPEPGFFDNWQWVNPQTPTDPGRREGYFWTHAAIGISAQHSEGVFALLVPRPPPSAMVAFYPNPIEPEAGVSAVNVLTASGCPSVLITKVAQNPIVPAQYFITLAAATTAVTGDVVLLGVKTGGYVSATVVTVAAGGKSFSATLSAVPACLDDFTTLFTTVTMGCSSMVLKYQVNAADATRIDLILKDPIKADTVGNTVTLKYGDGTTASATVVSFNMVTNKWVVDIGNANFVDQVGGVVEICVPTATNATCPGCFSVVTAVACT